jgi:hypothetical protein
VREGWAEAVPRKVILILDICALINSIKSLVYRQLGWVGVQKANNYNPSHIGHEAGQPPRNVYRILPTAVPDKSQHNYVRSVSGLFMTHSTHGTVHDADDS